MDEIYPFNMKENTLSKLKNLKLLLDNKNALESSINFLKQKTFDQIINNYLEIYKYRISMHLFWKETNKILLDNQFIPDIEDKVEITDDSKELCYDNCLKDFLFYFRENNLELIKIIELIPEEQKIDFSFFLCHLFYNNFINEKSGQDELIFIIYLLLEKEINQLQSPMEDNFLNESFMDYFFRAFLHRDDVKKYINNILISEIENINEKYFKYNPMDIIRNSKKHYKEYMNYKQNYTFLNMEKQNFYVNDIFHSKASNNQLSYSYSFLVVEQMKEDNIMDEKETLSKPRIINYENITINSILLPEFFNEINHNYIKKLLFQEKDEFMRNFYIKQLKSNKNDTFIFNCRDFYFEKMVKEKLISRESIENYNKGYKLIIKFLNNFLKNLENKNIIPFSIKIICKFIYILFKRKFPKIKEFQLYLLIERFLFDKLIIPIFENIECINLSEKEMISFDTRKTLIDIIFVLKKLIKGELITNKQYDNYKIFNQFILDNYSRIKNIIDNFIDIKLSKKILSLIEKSNKEQIQIINARIKNKEKNYIDFTSQKCICFNIQYLLLFYDIVNNNKNKFIKEGTEFENIFNELSKYIPQIDLNNNKYYIITKEEIQIDIELLYEQEKRKLSKNEEILNKLKFHIISLLSKIHFKKNWNCLYHYNTKQIFEYINRYLLEIEHNKKILPLNWYSKYILENLDLIDEKFKKDDYQLLYKIIENDISKLMTKLKKLNSFLSIHINKKYLSIEKKKKRLKKQYQEIKINILKMKIILFIEKAKIELCFIDGKKYIELQKLINKNQETKINNNSLIFSEINNCIHSKIKDEKYNNLLSNEELNQYHLHKIKDFAYKLNSYNKFISEEIMHYLINKRSENQIGQPSSKDVLNNNIAFIISSKEILNIFMNYINNIIQVSQILKPFQAKKEKELIHRSILDYILKSLCISIYEEKPLLIDNDFHQKCSILNSFVLPSHFKLSDKFKDKDILKDIIYYFEKAEEHRIPSSIYKEFEKAINLISLLFKFFFNNTKVESEEMLNMIIYCIILTKPKRMIFNTYFCKFFLMNDNIDNNFGTNISLIENAINIINKINAQFLNLSDQEFNEKCSKFKFINN